MDLKKFFLQPSNTTHRQYEALRAYFVEGLASQDAARRFGYTPGSFRVLCHQFRQDPKRQFFLPPSKGPGQAPIYRTLTSEGPEALRGEIAWNFTKFLIDGEGRIVARFEPSVDPMSEEVVSAVSALLQPGPSEVHQG